MVEAKEEKIRYLAYGIGAWFFGAAGSILIRSNHTYDENISNYSGDGIVEKIQNLLSLKILQGIDGIFTAVIDGGISIVYGFVGIFTGALDSLVSLVRIPLDVFVAFLRGLVAGVLNVLSLILPFDSQSVLEGIGFSAVESGPSGGSGGGTITDGSGQVLPTINFGGKPVPGIAFAILGLFLIGTGFAILELQEGISIGPDDVYIGIAGILMTIGAMLGLWGLFPMISSYIIAAGFGGVLLIVGWTMISVFREESL